MIGAARYWSPVYWAERFWLKVGSDQSHVVTASVFRVAPRPILAAPRRAVLRVPPRAVLLVPRTRE